MPFAASAVPNRWWASCCASSTGEGRRDVRFVILFFIRPFVAHTKDGRPNGRTTIHQNGCIFLDSYCSTLATDCVRIGIIAPALLNRRRPSKEGCVNYRTTACGPLVDWNWRHWRSVSRQSPARATRRAVQTIHRRRSRTCLA